MTPESAGALAAPGGPLPSSSPEHVCILEEYVPDAYAMCEGCGEVYEQSDHHNWMEGDAA